jgi:cell division transport system ATP-binding protein
MIRFDQVTKLYKGNARPALNAVTLEILRGEFVFLVGASGSGKSSFLRLVLKEENPSRGQIHVLGQNLGTLSSRKVPYFRRSLGVVFQDFRLLPQKNVFENVAFTLQVIGKSKGFIQEAVPDVLKMVGLAGKANRLPHELSGGEQQRVAIARAIVNKPAILLADEPTGNLDPSTSAGIMTLLERISASGTTVIMATHDAGIVDQMQRRVIELVSGQIIRDERQGGYQTQAVPIQGFSGPAISGRTQPVQQVPQGEPVAAPRQPTAPVTRPIAPGTGPVDVPRQTEPHTPLIRRAAPLPPVTEPAPRGDRPIPPLTEPHTVQRPSQFAPQQTGAQPTVQPGAAQQSAVQQNTGAQPSVPRPTAAQSAAPQQGEEQ